MKENSQETHQILPGLKMIQGRVLLKKTLIYPKICQKFQTKLQKWFFF